MTRVFIVSLSAFLIIALLDVMSFRGGELSNSVKSLQEYTEQEVSQIQDRLLNADFLERVQRDSVNQVFLSRLRRMEVDLAERFAHVQLRKQDSLIYWSGISSPLDYCRNVRKEDYTLKVCLNYFDTDSTLKGRIVRESGTGNQLLLTHAEPGNENIWATFGITNGPAYRSYRLNNLLITAYLLLALALCWVCFQSGTPLLMLGFAAARMCLLIFEGWHDRYAHSSIGLELFDWQSYSNIDLILDAFIVFNLLIYISKHIPNVEAKNKIVFSLSHGMLFVFLMLGHVRIIQHVALCEKFNVAINDISTINIPEIIIFSGLVVMLSGIFIFSVSFIQKLKGSYSTTAYYIWNLGFITVTIILSSIFQLELSPVYVFLFLFCFILLIDLFLDIRQKSITWLIWWAIFFGIYMSALFFNYDIKKQIENRYHFLENVEKDVSRSELQDIIDNGRLDSIMQSFSNLIVLPEEASYSKADIKNYLFGKFNKSDVVFDVRKNAGRSLFGSWPGKEQLVQLQEDYYFNEITNVLWKLNEGSEISLYTGLRVKEAAIDNFPFSYIRNGTAFSYGLNPTGEELAVMTRIDEGIHELDSRVVISHTFEDGSHLASIKEFESLVKPIALFSFLFTLIVLVFILAGLSSTTLPLLPEKWPLKYTQFESLNARIQTALIAVILLSFILVALVTSSFLGNFIESKNTQFLDEKITAVSRDLNSKIEIATSRKEALAIANNFEDELENIHGSKIDIFSRQVRDTPLGFFNYAYFFRQDYPKAYSRKTADGQTYESFMPFSFDNQLIGFIRLHSTSEAVKGFKLFDFLGSVFNIYVFLFLIASVLAIFIAKSITKPLFMLNQKLIELKLGKKNERINWDRDDEVGSLINNYNNMVSQLENSVELLAKTERDNAWREMAKQVAHEIKNPLTPMRMYIQHLEKAVKQQPERAVEISKKISRTLLEQVTNLTQIADSFSNFAELPQSSNEKIELNKVVELVHNLFRKRDDMEILMTEPIDPIYVYADKNQLIRILNNLVKNATESIPADRKGRIVLDLLVKDEKAIVKVSDNGSGIPSDMHEKIFQPKFTTKDSGSGLGLAIAQNMIESMNGRLYFKSKEGEGTSFFIELDIIRQNFEDKGKRITLD